MIKQYHRKLSAGRFAKLPVSVLNTVAVKSLSHAAFRVLVLLASQYHGRNNGALGVTRKQAAANSIASKNTLYAALQALELRGLIEQTEVASRRPPRPTMYAITWASLDDTEYSHSTRVATHAYRNFETPKKKHRARHKLRAVK